MAIIAGIPILALSVILQSTIFSRITLLNGTVDVVLLVIISWSLQDQVEDEWIWAVMAGAMVGFISAIPFWAPVVSYLIVSQIGVYLKRRVWQIPVLALTITVFVGTVTIHLISLLVLTVLQTQISLFDSLNIIILPSILLNLLAALPINGLVGELADWLYPEEIEG